ncbi:MAG: GNAT family N-acetyltransferase [Actinomycetota bacterium]
MSNERTDRAPWTIEDVPVEGVNDLAALGLLTRLENFVEYGDPEAFRADAAETFDPAALAGEMDEPGTRFRWVLDDGEPVAYVATDEDPIRGGCDPGIPGRGLHLHRLYVLGSHQGRGIGRALLDDTVAYASRGDRSFIWLCVWDRNPSAMAFYEHMGLRPFGEHSVDIGRATIRDVILSLDLR